MDDLSRQTIKGYEIQERIGGGGFGDVYRALQPLLKREVAIKIIRPDYANNPEYIRRFEAEAQMVARLDHLHIVPLYDYWRDPTGAYLVMRWLRGGSLRQALKPGGFSLEVVQRILEQIGAALTVAHKQDVIHRDLKPDNILLDEQGNAYLGDFGIAKDLATSQTTTGAIIGTPDYLSPEQIQGDPLTGQSDIYSLGIILYELLTGQKPYQAPTLTALLHKHLNEPLPSVRIVNPQFSEGIDMVIKRATSKDPTLRYSDAMAMARDFARAVSNVVGTRQPPQPVFTPGGGEITVQTITPGLINPYKGLEAFEQADAKYFYGREALTEQLVTRMREQGDGSRFLAVVGPSGSGKSSVVKASLIPELRQGALPGSENWYVVEIEPRAHPLEQLETALLRIAVNPPTELMTQLGADRRGLLRAVSRILPDDKSEMVLFIDQFEEVFTLVGDEAARTHFLDSLVTAVSDPASHLRVIITLRADFFDRPLLYAEFGALFRRRYEVVMPLTQDELRQAIVAPAERAGLVLEAGLVEALIHDVVGQPSGLPLLQYALTELFDHREGTMLTLDSYREIGRATGALASRAEQTYAELDAAAQTAARQLFLRLVVPGEGTEDTRRRVSQAELAALATDEDAMNRALEAFGERRLLTFDRDPSTRAPTTEIAHEALIRTWMRLWGWLDTNRADLRMQRNLMTKGEEWRGRGRDKAALLRDSILLEFDEWAQKPDLDVALTRDEREYLQASLDERTVQAQAEQTRQQHELALARQARNRARQLAIVAAAAFLLSLIGLIFIGGQNAQLNEQRRVAQDNEATAVAAGALALAAQATAEGQATVAAVNEATAVAAQATAAGQAAAAEAAAALAATNAADAEAAAHLAATAAAQAAINEAQAQVFGLIGEALQASDRNRPDVALAYALAAYERDNGAAALSLIDSATRSHIINRFTIGNSIRDVDVFGTTLAAAQRNGRIALIDTITGERLCSFEAHSGEVSALALHPQNGRTFVTASFDGSLRQWAYDPATQSCQPLLTFTEQNSSIWSVSYSHDGQFVLSGLANGSVSLWDASSGALIRTFDGHLFGVHAVAFSPNGAYAATGDEMGRLLLWNVDSGQIAAEQTTAHDGSISALSFAPNGRVILSAALDGTLRSWNADSASNNLLQELAVFVGHDAGVRALEISSDGLTMLSGGDDNQIIRWSLEHGTILARYAGHAATVTSLAFSGDERSAFSGSLDAEVLHWDLRADDLLGTLRGHQNTVTDLAWLPDASGLALSSSADGTLLLWDTNTLQIVRTFQLPDNAPGNSPAISALAVSANAQFAAGGSADGSINLWEIGTGSLSDQLQGGHSSAVNALILHPLQQNIVISGGEDGNIVIWNLADAAGDARGDDISASFRTSSGSAIRALALSADATLLAVGTFDGQLEIWDITNPNNPLNRLSRNNAHEGAILSLTFNQAGDRIVSGGDDAALKLWGIDGSNQGSFVGHTDDINSLAYSPDGQFLLSASSDGSLMLWLSENKLPLRRFVNDGTPIQAAAFSADGQTALSGGNSSRLLLWSLAAYGEGIAGWVRGNRYIPIVGDCEQRLRYNLTPLCDASGATIGQASVLVLPEAPTVFTPAVPVDTMPVSDTIQAALGSAEILQNAGYLAEALPEAVPLDLVNQDNASESWWIGGYHAQFTAQTSILWGEGADDDTCGVRFRQQDADSFYEVFLTRGGALGFRVHHEGAVRSEALDGVTMESRPGSSNRLLIAAVGNVFNVYVNEQLVGQFRDATHSVGRVALSASTGQQAGESSCTFSESWLWAMTGDEFTLPVPVLLVAQGYEEGLVTVALAEDSGALADELSNVQIDIAADEDNWLRWKQFSGEYRDFVVGASFRWGPGEADDHCGFRLRGRDNNNFYIVHVNQLGELIFNAQVEDAWSENQVENVTVNRGSSAQNELIVVVEGDLFSVYLNGLKVAEYRDNRLLRGDVALLAGTNEGSGDTYCQFSNAWLWELTTTEPEIVGLAEDVSDTLAVLDISAADGELVVETDDITIDLTDEDNLIRWETLDGEYDNFVISTAFRWGPGDDQDSCGVRFRAEDEGNFYFLEVDQNGLVRLSPQIDGEWDDSLDENAADVIRTGEDNANVLVLTASGDTFTVYINGALVAEFDDDRFESGELALVASTYEDSDETRCEFDRTWVWRLTSPVVMGADPEPTPLAPTPEPQIANQIEETLSDIGIPLNSGEVAEEARGVTIDMSGEDNLITWDDSALPGAYEDMVMGITFRWGPGAEEDTCGIVFRLQDSDNFYTLDINQFGDIRFQSLIDDEWNADETEDADALVNVGEGEENELVLVARGDTLRVYLNGEFAAEFNDREFERGTVALVAGTYDESEESFCEFDYAWVFELNGR
jgi:WD40 repeat protein/type II secretory pathway predicted ATPase ExeA